MIANIDTDRPVANETSSPSFVRTAVVRMVADKQVMADDGKRTCWATLALAYPYAPSLGDTVLLAHGQECDYIIGVLQCSDKMVLSSTGDITIESRGEITLKARKGVNINTTEISMRSTVLSIVADSVIQKYRNLSSTVKETLELKAGQVRNRIKGIYFLKANQINERATESVNIDGKKINLG